MIDNDKMWTCEDLQIGYRHRGYVFIGRDELTCEPKWVDEHSFVETTLPVLLFREFVKLNNTLMDLTNNVDSFAFAMRSTDVNINVETDKDPKELGRRVMEIILELVEKTKRRG